MYGQWHLAHDLQHGLRQTAWGHSNQHDLRKIASSAGKKYGQQTGIPVVSPPNAFWASAIVHAAAAVGATDGAAVGDALPPGVAQAVPHAALSVLIFGEQSSRQPRQPTYDSWLMACDI